MNKQKIGIYAWAGPGTIRLLRTKYHNPKIDERSFLNAYDNNSLRRIKELFGVTDAWVTYSWGFSDKTEEKDYKFITSRLINFKKNKIRTHAYIQGFNLVTAEFKDVNPWCRDFKGRLLPYSKGRSLTCPNNPVALKTILERVERACKEDFDGIFIDNIFFGLPPLFVYSDYMSYCGCVCIYCQRKFKKKYGYSMSLKEKRGNEVLDYLEFRADSTYNALKLAKAIAKKNKKLFGVNLYDPVSYSPEIYFGYSFSKVERLLSYYLIENLSLPSQLNHNNSYYKEFIQYTKKDVFIVSYRKGIGLDSEYSQTDMNAIYAEGRSLGYAPCIKISEYKTRGIWHYLDIKTFQQPDTIIKPFKNIVIKSRTLKKSRRVDIVVGQISNYLYAPFSNLLWDSRVIYSLLTKTRVLPRMLKKSRKYELGRF